MGSVDEETSPAGAGDADKTPQKDIAKTDDGRGGDAGAPSALAHDSDEERMNGVTPLTEAEILMEKRKQKAEKMIAKRPGVTLNPRKRYEQRKEEQLHEKLKAAAAAAASLETAKENEENRRMVSEEMRSWDAYELNIRNHLRMIEQEKEDRAAAAEKRKQEEERRLTCEEEGLTFDNGITVGHRRWRASPALATVLPAHPCPVHAMRLSSNGRWVLSGGDDLTVRLWDTEAFARKLADPNNTQKAAKAQEQSGAVAADLALGWECAFELVGHTASVRDVEFNPFFAGPLTKTQEGRHNGRGATGRETADASCGDEAKQVGSVKKDTAGEGGVLSGSEGIPPVRLDCMLASTSADLTVRTWDLSYNSRIARFVLQGHKGVVYACRFAPSGDRLASCSADGTILMWNVLNGTNVFCYEAHSSPVTSLCFSPSGRYLVSCSDIGERAIRICFAGMPLYNRDPVAFGMRLRWTRSGLIKRVKANAEPSSMAFFLSRQEDREIRESSDESAGEKEYRERLEIPKSVLKQCEANPYPSQAVSNGFSLTVTIMTDTGKDTRTEEYYRGCTLLLRARGLKKFVGLYVAGVSAEGLWEAYEEKGGRRYGSFFNELPEGMSLTAGRSIAAGEDINPKERGINEVVLRWKASGQTGVGWLTFRAVFRFHATLEGKVVLGRETVWVTLRERAPPARPASLFTASRLKPRKRNFDTVERTGLFVKALKAGDWAEATMMLSAEAKLIFGKVKATGAGEVTTEIRKVLGRNIIVHNGLSVGVAWTSVCMSHDPPASPSERERKKGPVNKHKSSRSSSKKVKARNVPKTVRGTAKSTVASTPNSPGSVSTAVHTVIAGGRSLAKKNASTGLDEGNNSRLHGKNTGRTMKERRQEKEKEGRGSGGSRAKKKKRDGRRRGGDDEGRDHGYGESTGRVGDVAGKEGWWQRQRRKNWRSRSVGALSQRTYVSKTRRSKRRGRSVTNGRSSGEEDNTIKRSLVEKDVRAELARLKRLKAARVAAWNEVGEATGLLSLAKSKRREKAREKRESPGLLESAGINVRDPKVNLKVLVWDGHFGSDVKEMRMPLPEFYPSSSTPYDQNEDVEASTLAEALALGDEAAPALIEEMRAEQAKKVDKVGKMVKAVLDRDKQLRKVGTRRRDAIVSSVDLAAAFSFQDARLTPLPRHCLPLDNNGGNGTDDAETVEQAGGESAQNDASRKLDSEEEVTASKPEVGEKQVNEGRFLARTTSQGETHVQDGTSEEAAPTPEAVSDTGGKLWQGAAGSGATRGGKNVTGEQRESWMRIQEKNETNVEENEKERVKAEKELVQLALAKDKGETAAAATTMIRTTSATLAPALPPLEASIVHPKLEGTASREKRRKQEARRAKQAPPVDPPDDFNLAKRRGGLGIIPGGASLIEVPAVGDWEKHVAEENGGLLRSLETRFGGLICHQDAINAVSYSPDGRRLASASSDGTIKLWDPSSGKQVRLLTGHHDGLPVWDVAWSGDSTYLVSCGADRSLVIWNTASSEPFVRRFLGHTDHVKRCMFADTRGGAVISCGGDGTIRKWVLTPNVPAPPPKPFVTHKTRTWVMLNWRPAAGSNEKLTAYVISWRLGRKGKFDDELTVDGDQLRRDVTGLLPGSVYFFRVAGVNRMGQGPWSEMSDMVDTEMDLPLAMERPKTEAVTSNSITISFFAPRPTLPKMKIQRFVLEAKGAGLDFDESHAQEFSWAEAMAGAAVLRGKVKTQSRSHRKSILSIGRTHTATSLGSTSCTVETRRTTLDGGSAESTGGGDVRVGCFSKSPEETREAAEGTCNNENGSVGGIVTLDSSTADERVAERRQTEAGSSRGAVDTTEVAAGDISNNQSGSVSMTKRGSSEESKVRTGPTLEEVKVKEIDRDTANNSQSPAADETHKTGESSSTAREATVEQGAGCAQSERPQLVRHRKSPRQCTRLGRMERKYRKSLRMRRKAHHYLMSLTYTGLRPGMNYHIRVAGISSVGQGAFSLPTFSVRTPAVPPGACPPPTASEVFLTAIMISWAEGDDGGSAVTGFVLRPTNGGESEEVSISRTKRSHLIEHLEMGYTYSFQVRAANNEGLGPWSEPSQPVRTLTQRPSAPRAPAIAITRPPPGPLSLWLSLFLPEDDGGDPVTAMLLETRRHGGTQPPEWSRCERHSVLPAHNGGQEGAKHASLTATRGRRSDKNVRQCGPRQLSGRIRVGVGADCNGSPSNTRTPVRACGEIVVLVDGLEPRTYYSFRVSAVNAQGAGDPGPPCRRIRTAAPRPPSWDFGSDNKNPLTGRAATSTAGGEISGATHAERNSDHKGKSGGQSDSAGGDTADDAAAEISHTLPRAVCSGFGACTVTWAEPFSNGAAIEFYQVEVVRIGPEVECSRATTMDNKGKECKVRESEEEDSAFVIRVDPSAPTAGNPIPKNEEDVDATGSAQQPSSPHKPDVLVLPASQLAGRSENAEGRERDGAHTVREVSLRFHRIVPSHMKHLVVRGLTIGSDYVFRVAASNAAGMGEAGPWTTVVRVVDPNDQD